MNRPLALLFSAFIGVCGYSHDFYVYNDSSYTIKLEIFSTHFFVNKDFSIPPGPRSGPYQEHFDLKQDVYTKGPFGTVKTTNTYAINEVKWKAFDENNRQVNWGYVADQTSLNHFGRNYPLPNGHPSTVTQGNWLVYIKDNPQHKGYLVIDLLPDAMPPAVAAGMAEKFPNFVIRP